jgi:hypothetical protein
LTYVNHENLSQEEKMLKGQQEAARLQAQTAFTFGSQPQTGFGSQPKPGQPQSLFSFGKVDQNNK